MSVINYATKFSPKVLERFAHESITDGMASKEYDTEFVGNKTVKIYELGTAPVQDYQRSGTARYGNPEDLDDYVLELTVTQDKASTWTIDKGNQLDQLNVKQAGQTLQRQIREVYTPMVDKYRLGKWANGAGTVISAANAPTKSTLVGLMLDLHTALDNAFVPDAGRTYVIKASDYAKLLLSDEFTKADSLMVKSLGKGTVGELFGVPVKKVPDAYMPAGVYFMEVYKNSIITPMKLKDFKVNTSPQGISGDLVEMRMYYDAFVLGTRGAGVGLCVAATSAVAAPTVTWASHVATLATTTSGATIKYTDDGSDPRYSSSAQTYNSSSKPTYTAAGTTLRVAAIKDGSYQSGVTDSTDA